ncbi:hypothetical protein, partial [Streptomyces poriferorum]|uniref:hypothetical protein n=1 Tax=Streptomyces poriferorum TaxID=2798799 RepID=UPI003557E53D
MTTGYGSGRGSLGEAGEDDEVPSVPAPEPGPVESAAFVGSEGADEDPRPGADADASAVFRCSTRPFTSMTTQARADTSNTPPATPAAVISRVRRLRAFRSAGVCGSSPAEGGRYPVSGCGRTGVGSGTGAGTTTWGPLISRHTAGAPPPSASSP